MTNRSNNRRWLGAIAAAGFGAGITYYMQSEQARINEAVRRTVGKSAKRIQTAIGWFDEKSSTTRRKVLEDNEQLRVLNLVAQAEGESRADYDILRKSVANLTETIEFVQRLKDEQEQRKAKARQQNAELPKEQVFRESESDREQRGYDVSLTESEEEEEEDNNITAHEEEKDDSVQNNLTSVASMVGNGLQAMSGLFFGSRRLSK